MSEDLAARLSGVGTVTRHADGTVLFGEGDPAAAAFVVIAGEVRIEVATPSGGRLVLAMKRAGELVGELGAVDGRPRSARAVTVGETDVRRIPAAEFVDVLESDGRSAVAVFRTVAAELRAADHRTTARNSADVASRLAARLLDLVGRVEPAPVGPEVELRLTQDDLAGWIGATREATARSLRGLREAGLVRTGRGRVVVLDVDQLAKWAR